MSRLLGAYTVHVASCYQRQNNFKHNKRCILLFYGVFMYVSCLQGFALRSVIHCHAGSIGAEDLRSYRKMMQMTVRLATWNQILDPWVYILLRRTVLHKIYLIAKCQAGLRHKNSSRWEPTSFRSSLHKAGNQV